MTHTLQPPLTRDAVTVTINKSVTICFCVTPALWIFTLELNYLKIKNKAQNLAAAKVTRPKPLLKGRSLWG